jgi:hypothetical protein
MQLVAYGAQDIYLTGNPMITYFKVVYRRHTNFAMESIQQTFNGTVGFGNRVSALISRNGDLVSGMVLEATLPASAAYTANADLARTGARWTDDVGHHLIKQVEVEIGGQLIDRHYSDWLEIWAQLTVPAGQKAGYRQMIGQDARDEIGQPTGLQAYTANNSVQAARKLYIPLQFWFCRNVGLALPLIALQYHEVKVNIQFEQSANLLVATANNLNGDLDATLWVDYIYLDTDERRRFAQVSHEYLIEQLQFNGEESVAATSATVELNFNHPVKELIWVTREAAAVTAKQLSNYTNAIPNVFPNQPALTTIDGQPLGLPHTNVIVGRRPNLLEASGQWFTKPRDMLDTEQKTATFVAGPAATLTLNTHGFSVGELVVITLFKLNAAANDNTAPTLANDIAVPNRVVVSSSPAVVAGHVYRVSTVPTANTFTIRALSGTADITFAQNNAGNTLWIGRYTPSPVLGVNPVGSAKLMLNGHDRFATRDGSYFNLVQPKQAHTNIPDSPGINVYSFALKPEEHQPSGTCNFSRIDNAKLQLTLVDAIARTVKVFATNYNVLRVMSGMGGLAYSN